MNHASLHLIKDFFLILMPTQCFFDTPGLMLKKSGFPYNDIKVRNESAWGSVSLYNVLIVVFDVHRHITRSGFLFPSQLLLHCVSSIYRPNVRYFCKIQLIVIFKLEVRFNVST